MQNPYLIRTAAVASLAAAVVAFGWMSAPGDEMQVSEITVAPTLPGAAVYFPAGFVLQPSEGEAEPYEYY
jgi:hypothetical protein